MMGTGRTWARRGLVIGVVVLVLGGAARADHNVTFNQVNATAGGTAIRGAATGGGDMFHGPVGVKGETSAASGEASGVRGEAASTSGRGVAGFATADSGSTFGVWGRAASTSGTGVFGEAFASSGVNTGVWGHANSSAGRGVFGEATAGSGTTYGVRGQAASSAGTGIFGWATAPSGNTTGVLGRTESPMGRGVWGAAVTTSGSTFGVYGQVSSPDGRGVHGVNLAASGTATAAGVFGVSLAASGVATGVYGEANSPIGRGVVGRARATSGPSKGVVGRVDSASGIGVLGDATHAAGGIGVQGVAASPNGFGIWSQGHARVEGNLHVNGNITKTGAGELVLIDDPQRRRQVVYASQIGPEPGTYVRGTARLVKGQAVIALPDHFAVATAPEGLTVTLTPVGGWLQLYVQQQSVRRLVIREASGKSGAFHYRVDGIRKGYEGHQVVVPRR